MATKKKPVAPSRTKPKAAVPAPARTSPGKLHNLAARPSYTDMNDDEQLVDNSGVFRVTTDIARAQIGHDEDDDRFASDSLVMKAQQDNFREEGPTLEQAVDDTAVEDEAFQAQRRERLRTLAARAQARRPTRR
ncbi:MAG: hypothetical protein JNL83_39755 [Myxococcales bacterium]|nr:hypothetical protein [Myxococcales bacterium]